MRKIRGPKQRRQHYFRQFRRLRQALRLWEKEIEEAGFELQDLDKWAERVRQISAAADQPEPLPPTAATNAEPGSEEKIAVMVARASRGESVFHPDDRRRDADDSIGVMAEVLRNGRLKKKLRRRKLSGEDNAPGEGDCSGG